MPETVTLHKKKFTLVDGSLKVGESALPVQLCTSDLETRSLDNYSGKVKVVTTFPSLDTPVCDLQIKEFNKRAVSLSADTVVLAVSCDLPFAQKRFCLEHGIERIELLSDYRQVSLGTSWGLLIKELRLLARSVIIIDKQNIVRYCEIVPELSEQPNYDAALSCLAEVLASE